MNFKLLKYLNHPKPLEPVESKTQSYMKLLRNTLGFVAAILVILNDFISVKHEDLGSPQFHISDKVDTMLCNAHSHKHIHLHYP